MSPHLCMLPEMIKTIASAAYAIVYLSLRSLFHTISKPFTALENIVEDRLTGR